MNYLSSDRKGFTLIELLVVIAVLGVLAGVILIAINPLDRIKEGKDAGRKSTVGQFSGATQSYYTGHNGTYPTADATWIDILVSALEIKNLPPRIDYLPGTSECSFTAQQNYFCYNTDGTEAIIYATLEADSNKARCESFPGTTTYFLWASAQSQVGIVCETVDPGTADKFSGFTFIP